jgi:hypothetical protein
MQNIPQQKPKKPTKPINTDSFLEAIRSLGSSTGQAAGGEIKDLSGRAWKQLAGNWSDFPDLGNGQIPGMGADRGFWQEEKESRHKKQAFFERQKSIHEKIVFTKADQQTKMQIQALQDELKKMAASTHNLAREVQVAVMQAPVNPGVYHQSFFEKLRLTIREIKKRIDQSASWLGAMNSKGKKQSHYWSQVGKSGTKYMLSQERYMQTSAG